MTTPPTPQGQGSASGRERGIIMSGDNPKLIRDGRKTQTRRIVKPQPVEDRTWTSGAVIVRPNGNKIGVGSFGSYPTEALREFSDYDPWVWVLHFRLVQGSEACASQTNTETLINLTK